jgi:spore coat polysaccharide biosynthesis protein SpsF (cytidylyltransferase family)
VQVVESYGLTEVIRATADNPCVDMDAPLRTLTLLRRTRADHVVEHGLPYGAAVEAVSGSALIRANALATEPYDREHVTPLIRRDPSYRAVVAVAPGFLRRPSLRLTVDTYEDLKAVRAIVTEAEREHPAPVLLKDLITVALRMAAAPDAGGARQGTP